jgi:hypothetical protein
LTLLVLIAAAAMLWSVIVIGRWSFEKGDPMAKEKWRGGFPGEKPKPPPAKDCKCFEKSESLLKEIVGLLKSTPVPGETPGLRLGVSRVVGRNIVMATVPPIEIVDVEKVVLSIAPKDADGRDVASPNAAWTSSDESVITLQVSADTLSAVAVSGAPGTSTVSVSSGSLSDQIDITVKVGAPSSLNLSAGAPEPE